MKFWVRLAFSALITLFAIGMSVHVTFAQATPTAEPTLLPLNEPVHNSITGGERINYRIDVPADQDVVIVLRSDRSMFYLVCSLDPATNYCEQGGGGGDNEHPTDQVHLFPANGQVQHAQIQMRRYFDDSAEYTLTAHTVTPTPLEDYESQGVAPPAGVPVQVYSLQAHPTLPFTVEVEDDRKDGDFLWVAFQPWLYESVRETSDNRPPIGLLDSSSGSDTSPLQFMDLYYAGGRDFRLLVDASGHYSFHILQTTMLMLDPDETVLLTVSYQRPMEVVRLQTLKNDVAHIQLQVTKGAGAWVSAYTAGNPRASYQALGVTPNSTLAAPLTATMEHAAGTNFGSYLVVQVPNEFTRDFATVSVNWSPHS